jgi:Ca2+/H+ antiporter, TMEM165/GDT1 family
MIDALSVLATAYAAVLAAELLGDRSLCAICAMAARFRPWPLLLGVTLAFMGKTLAAVLLGRALGQLAGSTVSLVSAISFVASAALLWRRRIDEPPATAERSGWAAATPVAFSSVFFTEWADVGQITTAALVARYHAPTAVWIGATLALVTKGVLAITLGVGLRSGSGCGRSCRSPACATRRSRSAS